MVYLKLPFEKTSEKILDILKISNIDKLTKYINDYKFEVEKEPYILESKAFMEKLEEHQKK
ncbi:MAG: hypothetical protein U1E31_02180 [Rickettsiales bacterium]